MKLYYPTSSLNFNDIFATESISPKKYYFLRRYGTRRHFTTELSFDDNYIFLFKDIPYFELLNRSNSSLEEYPMILELNIEETSLLKISEEIYAIKKTIYFNINNLNVLFLLEDDMKKVIKKSTLIIETKSVSKYKNNFKVIEFKNFKKMIKPKDLKLPTYNIQRELDNERRFNNIKGLLYGYFCKRLIFQNDNAKILREIAFGLNDILIKSEKLTGESEVINDILLLAKKQIKKQYSNSKKDALDLEVSSIFEYSADKGIRFNEKISDMHLETELFEIIINYLINNPKQKVGYLESNEINIIVKNIKELVQVDKNLANYYYNDVSLIYNRFILNNYEIDIKQIKSIVLQNLYAFLLKYNNIEEMKSYVSVKSLDKEYILYAIIGSFIGYSGLDRELTEKLFSSSNIRLLQKIDNYLYELNNNISIIENEIINNSRKNVQIEFFEEQKETKVIKENKNYMKDIYQEILSVKQNKKINQLLKNKKIILNDGTEVVFEKEQHNIIISIIRKQDIFEILLVYKTNVTENDLKTFKLELKLFEVPGSFTRGNYPLVKVFKIENDEKFLISQKDQKSVCNIITDINTYII